MCLIMCPRSAPGIPWGRYIIPTLLGFFDTHQLLGLIHKVREDPLGHWGYAIKDLYLALRLALHHRDNFINIEINTREAIWGVWWDWTCIWDLGNVPVLECVCVTDIGAV